MAFHAHLETQMADGQQNRFPGVRSCAHLGGAGGHTRGVGRAMGYTEGWEGRGGSTRGEKGGGLYRGGGKGGGLYRGVERGSTGAWGGGVEIIVEKFGKRWNKMEKYS